MWNSRMHAALHSHAIDVAVALCADIADDLAYESIRSEATVALLAANHPLAGESTIDLGALVDESFVLFPRELAPRLYDTFVALCRQQGFEPRVHKESFHTIWELRVLDDAAAVALAPASVAHSLPAGVVAVPLNASDHQLETSLAWRPNDRRPVLAAFLEIARGAFANRNESD
jgi:DNA-binding transcriptional LysR family regulator